MQSDNGRSDSELKRMSTFELSGKIFGLDISNLNEVIKVPQFTPLPNSNGIYHGVFNLRGEIFPLVDISPILELANKRIQDEDMVIIIHHHDVFLGILVDKILSIVAYYGKSVKNPQGVVSRSLSKFVQGIVDHKGKIIHILDLDSLFKTQNLLAYF
jgi:chemotaxis signal transduction protein